MRFLKLTLSFNWEFFKVLDDLFSLLLRKFSTWEGMVLNLIGKNILVQKVLCFHVRKTILIQLSLWVVAAIHKRSDVFTNICGLQIPVADGDRGYGGFATLDVQSVNLIKYPKFKQVRWQYANMTPGDCLFLPYSKHYLLVLWCNQSKKFLSFYWFFLKPLVLHPALLLLTYYVLVMLMVLKNKLLKDRLKFFTLPIILKFDPNIDIWY